MNKKVDLHIHTHFSDGKYSPQEIINMAKDQELDVIAITDHDSARAIRDLKENSAGKLFVVPGIEISTKADEFKELHILGLGINPNYCGIKGLTGRYQKIFNLPNVIQMEIKREFRDFYQYPEIVKNTTIPFLSEVLDIYK